MQDVFCSILSFLDSLKTMFDRAIREKIDPALNKIGLALASKGVSANGVTYTGFALSLVAALCIVQHAYWLGLFVLLASRLCDGLDGAVARVSSPTDFGGLLDIVLDFAFYGLIPAAFIIADPTANAVAGAVLLLVFYVNGASFLTFALMAEKRGLKGDARGSKSLLYTTGLAEGSETIFVFVLFCLIPEWFSAIAYIFAAVVAFTTTSRLILARQTFRDAD